MGQYQTRLADGKAFLINGKYNIFKVNEWEMALESQNFDIVEYDELILYFSVSTFQAKNGFSAAEQPCFLQYLEKEIYNVLSNKENKGKADILLSSTISSLGAAVANQFQLNVFIISGFLNLIILSILKVGIGAWCCYYEEKNKNLEKNTNGE